MPAYDKYYSLSVFDMNHFMEVFVMPEKPVVVRLASQKSPVEDAHEIVLQTYQGLVFTRQVVVDNEAEVLQLAKDITISGGGGNKPFIVPSFTEAEAAAGDKIIQEYALKVPNARKLFGSTNEGVGDLDRAAGVFLGQLGTQAWTVDYAQYVAVFRRDHATYLKLSRTVFCQPVITHSCLLNRRVPMDVLRNPAFRYGGVCFSFCISHAKQQQKDRSYQCNACADSYHWVS